MLASRMTRLKYPVKLTCQVLANRAAVAQPGRAAGC